MDTIWDRIPSKSKVIGRCGGDEKTRMITQNRQKSIAKKHTQKSLFIGNEIMWTSLRPMVITL